MILTILSVLCVIASIIIIKKELREYDESVGGIIFLVFAAVFFIAMVVANCDVLIYSDTEQQKYEQERQTLVENYNYVLEYDKNNFLELPSLIELRNQINDYNMEVLQKKANRKNVFTSWISHDIDVELITITERGAK